YRPETDECIVEAYSSDLSDTHWEYQSDREITCLAASADGRYVALGTNAGSVEVLVGDTGALLATYSGAASVITGLAIAKGAFDDNHRVIAASTFSGEVAV